jgi:thiopurine S-methyltransferase
MSTRWHESWQAGRIGFHSSAIHQDLVKYQDKFLGDGPHRVLVPLCGKTVDMAWLAEQGHEVVGVELVPQAVEEFFEEQELRAEVEAHEGYSLYRSGRITIACGDMLALGREVLGSITRIWDRAALVALPYDVRVAYAAHLRALSADGARLLANVFEYDQSKMSGPPFSITDEEMREHFRGCEIELLDEHEGLDGFPRFRELGNEYWTVRTYLIDRLK